MPIFGDHTLTAVTIKVNQLVEHKNDELEDAMELYLSDLLGLINVQRQSGATEAARAIRKKIKYGDSVKEQIRALQLLELLVLNSGVKIGPIIARDDKLLDVLKGILNGHGKTGSGTSYNPKVGKTVTSMAVGWKSELDGLKGYEYMQGLYKAIPGVKKRSKALSSSNNGGSQRGGGRADENEDGFDDDSDPYGDDHALDDDRSVSDSPQPRVKSPKVPPPRPTTASPYSVNNKKTSNKKDRSKNKKSKKKRSKNGIVYADSEYGIPQINYKLEAPKIRKVLTECNDNSITLNNQLLQLPPDTMPQDDDEIMATFQKCKKNRRKVLKYLQFVGAGDPSEKSSEVAKQDEEFLAKLIYANEQLVETFKKFDIKAGYSQTNPAPAEEEELSESDESYYSTDDDDEEMDENELPGEDSIAARLQSVTLENKRPPPPPPPSSQHSVSQASKYTGPEQLESTKELARPGLAKMETSESLGDPFGDKHTVDKVDSVYY
ncbi:hypothetical protein KGF57_005336 [Candida theae]|uniref:VHS domain-containing protein n=1 Tax=Candida theae TaxID=1198502 RepID=A0AAD5B9R8_9ASCO|nr:uncharacterized protein KGF57_005336 [Candida theae]KAI5948725.1 hypothetical protein KGF57_005336 [Candida theae]